uniref:Uncharacterized protein n=1 Tax=Rhizophora mucronata TaxID=61149 RepID=A0A2P2JTJ3_RHIMU
MLHLGVEILKTRGSLMVIVVKQLMQSERFCLDMDWLKQAATPILILLGMGSVLGSAAAHVQR